MGPFLTAVKCAVPLECEQCYYSGGVPLGCTLVHILVQCKGSEECDLFLKK